MDGGDIGDFPGDNLSGVTCRCVGEDTDTGLGVRARGDFVLSGETPKPAAASAPLREEDALMIEELAEKKSIRRSCSTSSLVNMGKLSSIGSKS